MRPPPPTDELLTLTQACELIGLQEAYIYAASRHGLLRTTMVGRRRKYLSREVEELAARIRARDPEALRAVRRGGFELDQASRPAA